jgi:hypothetical protein
MVVWGHQTVLCRNLFLNLIWRIGDLSVVRENQRLKVQKQNAERIFGHKRGDVTLSRENYQQHTLVACTIEQCDHLRASVDH